MNVNLNFLECFVLVSKTLSFTEAAHALRVSQPSVSRQIRLLEQQLGVQLFLRDRHKVHLTEAGKRLRASLTPLIREIQTHLALTHEQSASLDGTIAFGSLAEIGQSTFMKLLLNFRSKHPGIDLHIEYAIEQDIVQKVKSGQLDFGVINTPISSENIRAYHLMTERIVMVTRAKNRLEFNSQKNPKFIGYQRHDELLTRFLNTLGHTHGRSDGKHLPFRKIHSAVTVNSHRSMIESLIASDCYAVMPYLSVQPWIESGKLRTATNKEVQTQLYLIHLETPYMEKKNIAFREHLIQSCRSKTSSI